MPFLTRNRISIGHPHRTTQGAPLQRASSAQHLDTHSLRGSSHGAHHGHGPSSSHHGHHQHHPLDGSGGTPSTTPHHDASGAPLSSPLTYSPHHPHHFQFASASGYDTGTLGATGAASSSYFGFEEGMARTLKQQNDLILQRCALDFNNVTGFLNHKSS